jgi:Ca-activated chloride channel family protein
MRLAYDKAGDRTGNKADKAPRQLSRREDRQKGGFGSRALLFFGFVVALVMPQGVTAEGFSEGPLHIEILQENPYLLTGKEGPVNVLVRMTAQDISPSLRRSRPRVNLSMVLDRSGSMEERGKLEYVKPAASLVVDRLERKDRLSIVEYDDRITLMWPSAPVESPHIIKQLIHELTPRGSTNLAGGMMRGVDEVAAHFDEAHINRVLLLSDGLANVGVTSPVEIRRLVREARAKGVQISTLGLGLDYNEDLMQAIAEVGGGRYYYVESPQQMSRIFEEELNTLFATRVRNIVCTFEAEEKTDEVQAPGYESQVKDGALQVPISDFYTGEKRSMLLRIPVSTKTAGRLALGDLVLHFTDAESGRKYSFRHRINLIVTDDAAKVHAARNDDVKVETALIEAEEAQIKAMADYAKGDLQAAQRKMSASRSKLKETVDEVPPSAAASLNTKLEALAVEEQAMAEAASPEDRSHYMKKGKQRLYQAQKGDRTLYKVKEGDKGLEVERLQQALQKAGYYKGPVDGIYSAALRDAVKEFQRDKALVQDGMAGPLTLKALGLY